jgi:DNA-binding IclR family transcriptional regulator
MEAQTYSLFQALGARAAQESLELLVALLEQSDEVEVLVARTGISSSTVSRRLDDMLLVGLVSRQRARGAYRVACPEETRRFLEAASGLALAALGARAKGEENFRRRVAKTRMKPSGEADGESISA